LPNGSGAFILTQIPQILISPLPPARERAEMAEIFLTQIPQISDLLSHADIAEIAESFLTKTEKTLLFRLRLRL